MATAPAARRQAIEVMRELLTASGATPEEADDIATSLVDQAITERGR